ncbi:hypothetical protein A6R68_22430, partial [Neotoma lepida]
ENEGDFESFDLPKEHQIAHLPLNGVPLMILKEESGLEKLLHLDPPSPLKTPFLSWESNPLQSPSSILSTLDVELPPTYLNVNVYKGLSMGQESRWLEVSVALGHSLSRAGSSLFALSWHLCNSSGDLSIL